MATNQDLVMWLSLAIGVVGVGATVFLAFYVRQRPRIATQISTLQLLGQHAVLPKDIAFLFRGRTVPSVALSRVALWNIGNTTIRGDQIVSADPFRLVASAGSEILDAVVLKYTRQVNDVTCVVRQAGGNEVECRFDFLDPGDGALLQLIHTGNDQVSAKGVLRGVPKGVLVVADPYKAMPQQQATISPQPSKLTGSLFLVMGLLIGGVTLAGRLPSGADLQILRVLGGLLVVAGLVAFWSTSRRPPALLNTRLTTTASK